MSLHSHCVKDTPFLPFSDSSLLCVKRDIWSQEDCLLNHHLHWHLALFYLAKGRISEALAEYDSGIEKVGPCVHAAFFEYL